LPDVHNNVAARRMEAEAKGKAVVGEDDLAVD